MDAVALWLPRSIRPGQIGFRIKEFVLRFSSQWSAIHAAMNDLGFLAAAASVQIEIKETSSERVTEVIAAVYALPPEVGLVPV